MKMLEKLYKWLKSGTAAMLALLLLVTVLDFTVPVIGGDMLEVLGGVLLSSTLVLYAIRNLGLLGMGCCKK